MDADSTRTYLDPPLRRGIRKVLAVLAVAIYLGYLIYRARFTLNPEALAFSVAVYLAEIHGFFSLVFYYFQIWELHGRTVPPPPEGLSVDVYITTFNEEVDLLRQTVRGAINMRYPHRTLVLDDGRRAEVSALCAELGCEYLTRDTNEHAKAGNWNNAFRQTTGALIATFDADHVPRADFLERTLGFFADPKVAFVQVPQRFHNLDSIQHRVSWRARRKYDEQDVFFNLVMPGKDHWNASFFCGTGAVLRREALEPYGGQLTDTNTEDMHTALELQTKGWKAVYLNELLVTGLAPMDFASYNSQRLRWAEGNLKTIRLLNPLTCRGLTFGQRICYFASMYHWSIGLAKIVFYTAPPLMLFTGQYPIANFDLTFFMIYGVHVLSLVGSYWVLSRGTGRLVMDELFNMANFYTLLLAIGRFVFSRRSGVTFVVTNKRGGESNPDQAVLPHYVLIAVTVLALVWSWLGLGLGVTEDRVGAGIATFWACYNLALMLVVAGFARRPVQKRQAVRFRTSVPIELLGQPANGSLAVSLDLSEGGCTLLWPGHLRVGTALRLRLHLGSMTLDCDGQVASSHGRHRSGWIGHGIRFEHTRPEAVDQLADAIYNMCVPELLTRLSRPSLPVRVFRALSGRVRGITQARALRQEAFLPLRVQSSAGEFLATTRDLSRNGLALITPHPLEPGTTVRLVLRSPAGEWNCPATVMRSTPSHTAVKDYRTWQVGLRLDGHTDVVALRQILAFETVS